MALTEILHRLFEIGQHPFRLTGSAIRQDDGFTVETISFTVTSKANRCAASSRVQPANDRPLPAILYIHAHGDRYDIGASELVDGQAGPLQSPLGPVFARAGYVTLAIDLPCFGGRAAAKEQPATKALLWRGRSLAGQMLGELSSAL